MSIKSFDKLRKYLPFGAFGVSLLLHLAIFLGISGIIIIQATSPKTPFTATPDTTQQAGDIPPPELPPDEAPATPDVNTSPDDNHSSSSQLMPSMETISSNNSISAPTFNVLPSGPIATGGAPQNPAPGTYFV
jgi:cytoskeletal protein RodZ